MAPGILKNVPALLFMRFLFAALSILFLGSGHLLHCANLPTYTVERLNDGRPIIDKAAFDAAGVSEDGGNINGPCLVKIPDWIAPEDRADPEANYYLYFAHHGGNYIRMAWAEAVIGPYTLYNMRPELGQDERGVYALPQPEEKIIVETNTPGQRIEIRGHIASPRVLVDHENQRFVMFFHAMTGVYETEESTKTSYNGQKTVLTTSADGLDFNGNLKPIVLGRSYFHVWDYGGRAYAFANDGQFFVSPEGSTISNDGWWHAPAGYDHHHNHVNHPLETSIWRRIEPGPIRAAFDADANEGIDDPRHFATRLVGDQLHVFYTCRNDGPEVILLNKIDLSDSGDWETWETSWPPEEVLRPEREWEGANYPPEPSSTGGATGVNQLRDPFVYEEDGRIYLFYTGAGEEAIGLAELTPTPVLSSIEGRLWKDGDDNQWLAADVVRRTDAASPWTLETTDQLQATEWDGCVLDGINHVLELLSPDVYGDGCWEKLRFRTRLQEPAPDHLFLRLKYPR